MKGRHNTATCKTWPADLTGTHRKIPILRPSSDPTRQDARILSMLQQAEPVEQSVALPVVQSQLNRHENEKKTIRTTKVGHIKGDENITWVTCMTHIRDTRDKEAFGLLFAHFAPRVKAFLMRGGSDASLAEECAQDVMITVWRKAGMYDPSRASVATWVFTIARNRKIDLLRKQRRPEPEELTWGSEHEPEQTDIIGLQQESEQLGRALAALPEKQRELIEKAYFGDLSHSEIADQTGLPLGTIKSRIRLALDRLRHSMK